MEVYENECCDCKVPGYPCLGNSCSRRQVRHLRCDRCNSDCERLYVVGNGEFCADCALDELEVIT